MFNPLDYPILFEQPCLTSSLSAWRGHIPFAMFLIQASRPQTLVELGTHSGVSYCAFCQGVIKLNTDTECYAVDTWQGDQHTNVHDYGVSVLDTLREHHDPLYSSFSHLIQSTFDNALPRFADGSISLLHIDGFHSYDAVRHDFETWLPKMQKDGVILFHDISVLQESFGVHRFWNEIKTGFVHFEFHHCNGLGVLALNNSSSSLLNSMLHASQEEADMLRTLFRGLGNSLLEEDYTRLLEENMSIVTSRSWKAVSAIKRVVRPGHRSQR